MFLKLVNVAVNRSCRQGRQVLCAREPYSCRQGASTVDSKTGMANQLRPELVDNQPGTRKRKKMLK